MGFLFDWDNRWALRDAQGFQLRDKKLEPTLEKHYNALWKRGINTDIISFDDDFSAYKLIIAPMLYLIPEAIVEKLAAYVAGGGTLLCTYTTGMVGENDLCYLGGFPGGKLKEVFGIWNEEIDTLYPDDRNAVKVGEREYTAIDYCERIHPSTATVLGTYREDFYAGEPALTVNTYGKGKAYYIAFRDTGDLTDDLTAQLLDECGISSDFDGALPKGVTAHSRTDGENLFVFLQNFTTDEQTLSTAFAWSTVEDATPVSGTFTLAPYETLILTRRI